MLGSKSTVRFLYIINSESISVGFQGIIVGFVHDFDVAFSEIVAKTEWWDRERKGNGIKLILKHFNWVFAL